MKLSILHEAGHWKTVSGSGYTDPKSNKKIEKKKRDLSMLTHPEDRQRFVNWGKKK